MRARIAPLVLAAAVTVVGCAPVPPAPAPPTPVPLTPAPPTTTQPPTTTPPAAPVDAQPWHTRIVATTFWVGEVFDPTAADGSQTVSTYDGAWLAHYGGCDGRVVAGVCGTEVRAVANGYFPTAMSPRQNPFYLDLPFDDVNDPRALARRGTVVPWAAGAGAAALADPTTSLLKNRWVRLRLGGATCYGQVEDAGPGEYDDAAYVFGTDDARPLNHRYGGAGLDVSPALNGCLGFTELDGDDDRVDWQFVEADQVPAGPWRTLVTTVGVSP